MNEHGAKVLGFPKVLDALAGQTRTPQGGDRARALKPRPTLDDVREGLGELKNFEALVVELGHPPLDSIARVEPALAEAATPGACLDVETMLLVRDTVAGAARLIEYLEDAAREKSPIGALAEGQRPLYDLEALFARTFGPRGEILDSASPELRRLRGEIRSLRARVLKTLKTLLQDTEYEHVVQDDFITERSHRYVIPLRTDFRGYMNGIVHDHSNTGQTVFVEPMEVVETNNKVNIAKEEEEAEVRRILIELTARLGRLGPQIIAQIELAARVDVLNAKLLYGRKLEGVLPVVDERPVLAVTRARHPLLALRQDIEVVPVDLKLADDERLLLVTGANAGGKTVAMKTAGLVALMAHSGMFIPAAPESVVGWFPQVLADIGDEQDIDLDLSTFSAHMERLREIFEAVTPGTLVLLDELGTGTDPAQGAALSVALLEELQSVGARVLSTTHLDGLKAFVYGVEWGVNAAVAFDPKNGQPLYRLHYGQAGSSNALETAARMGVPQRVLDRARSIAGEGGDSVGRLVSRLEESLEEARKAKEEAQRASARLEADIAKQKELLAQARDERKLARQDARKEAREMIRRMREELSKVLREVREGKAELKEAQAALEEGAQEIERRFPKPKARGGEPLRAAELTPGREVFIRSLGKSGVIENADNPAKVRVRIGMLATTVQSGELFKSANDAAKAGDKKEVGSAPPAKAILSGEGVGRVAVSAERGNPDINVIGKNVEEALGMLDAAVDKALVSGVERFRVIHGRGTGRLRQAVRSKVADDPKLKQVETEEMDDAVTWVELV